LKVLPLGVVTVQQLRGDVRLSGRSHQGEGPILGKEDAIDLGLRLHDIGPAHGRSARDSHPSRCCSSAGRAASTATAAIPGVVLCVADGIVGIVVGAGDGSGGRPRRMALQPVRTSAATTTETRNSADASRLIGAGQRSLAAVPAPDHSAIVRLPRSTLSARNQTHPLKDLDVVEIRGRAPPSHAFHHPIDVPPYRG
jgi:hypothetical protein